MIGGKVMKRFLNKLFETIRWQCAILLIVLTVDAMVTGSVTQKFLLTLVVDTIGFVVGYITFSYFWDWLDCRKTMKMINEHADSSDFKCVKVKKLN